MGLNSSLFYDQSGETTLLRRISLSDEQIQNARNKKDTLLREVKPKLTDSFGVPVKHWLQGSYKNHTLVRPVIKGDEFDIDIGLYMLCDAESSRMSPIACKKENRRVLGDFCGVSQDAELQEPKTNCERISYPGSLHIDIPLYYYDERNDTCKLASERDEWSDSDPKAFQDWFDSCLSEYSESQRAQVRRIIKYLKVWTLLKGQKDGVSVPSIAITILVTKDIIFGEDDDDVFARSAVHFADYILDNQTLENPAQGGDVLGFSDSDYQVIRQRAKTLRRVCEYIDQCNDSFRQYLLWSATFEHMFPPFAERQVEVGKKTNLPAKTIPPKISVRLEDRYGNRKSEDLEESVSAYRTDKLRFTVQNAADYAPEATVHWVVRNQNTEAEKVNDLGHTSVQDVTAERYEDCAYAGIHYMECFIRQKGEIAGVASVKVRVSSIRRPDRNPPKRRHFKR
jgi:hypothetical protein